MPKKIDPIVKERCVRQVLEHLPEYPSLTAAAESVARREGLGKETVRRWVVQAQIDGGQRRGATSEELAEIKELKAKVRRLEEDNEILRRASIFFAGELDPRNRWSSRSSTNCDLRATRSSRSAESCASRAARSPRGPTATGHKPTTGSRPGPSAMPRWSTRSVTWSGRSTTRACAG